MPEYVSKETTYDYLVTKILLTAGSFFCIVVLVGIICRKTNRWLKFLQKCPIKSLRPKEELSDIDR